VVSVEIKTTLNQKVLKDLLEKVLTDAGIEVIQVQINQIH